MKKALCILMLLLFLPACGLCEGTTLACPYEEGTPQGALAEALGGLIDARVLYLPGEMDTRPINEMLSDPSVLCLHTGNALIRGLQGYADGELREDMRAVCQAAADDLYIVATKEAAREAGLKDLFDMVSYLAENEYGLALARLMDASAEDYAATALLNALALDQALFVDAEDLNAGMEGAALLLIKDTRGAKALEKEGAVVLGALSAGRTAAYPALPCAGEAGLPVVAQAYYGLFASSKAPENQTEAAEAVCASPEWREAVSALGFLPPFMPAERFRARVTEDFALFVDYMTAEGLFFYEE